MLSSLLFVVTVSHLLILMAGRRSFWTA